MSSRALEDRYDLLATLMQDGHRRVFRAFDRVLRRPVVLKGVVDTSHTDEINAIRAEFQRLSAHPHPSIVEVYDFFQLELAGKPFVGFSQAWLSGLSLRDLRGRMPPQELEACFVALLEVVAFLHHRGLVRLDLKAAHWFSVDYGWCLIDLDQADVDTPLALAGMHGTALYMAPEVLVLGESLRQSDLYSIGVMAFEALTGAPPPLPGRNLEEAASLLMGSPVPEIPEAIRATAPAVAALTSKLLARSPQDRPASAEEALTLLGRRGHRWRLRCPAPPLPLAAWPGLLPEIEALEAKIDVLRGGVVLLSGSNGTAQSSQEGDPAGSSRSAALRIIGERWQLQGRPTLALPGGDGNPLEMLARALMIEAPGVNGTPAPRPNEELADTRERLIRTKVGELLEAVGQRLPSGPPLWILIDDADTLDELTQAVLARLVPHLAGSGLALLLGVNEANSWPAWIQRLALNPASSEEARHLAETLLGPGALGSSEAVEQLLLETAGSPPLIAGHLWRSWALEGTGELSVSAPDPAMLLLAGLSDEARQAAYTASILEHPFLASQLEGIREGSAAGIPSLAQVGILIRAPNSEDVARWQFRLESSRQAIRKSLSDTLSEMERQALHRRAAEMLEFQVLEGEVPAAVVALHLLEAGEVARARPYLHRAVQEAVARLKPGEACRILRRWIDATPNQDPLRIELLLRLGQLELDAGELLAADLAFSGAADEAGERAPILRARALAGQGHAHMLRRSLPRAAVYLEQALAVAAGALTPSLRDERSRWWLRLAWVRTSLGNLEAADAAVSQAIDLGIKPDSRTALELVAAQASLALRSTPLGLELPVLENALERAAARGDERVYGGLHNAFIEGLRRRGQLERAREQAQVMVTRAHASFDLNLEAIACHNLAGLMLEQGAAEEALETLQTAASLHARAGDQARAWLNQLDAIALLLEHRRFARAELHLAALRQEISAPTGSRTGLYHALLEVRLRQAGGQRESIRESLLSLRDGFEALGDVNLALEVVADLMALHLEQGEPEAVLALFAGLDARRRLASPAPLRARLHAMTIRAHEALMPKFHPPSSAGPEASPQSSPQLSPQSTPQASPQASPQTAPQSSPQSAPQSTPEPVLEVSLDQSPSGPTATTLPPVVQPAPLSSAKDVRLLEDRRQWLEHVREVISLEDDVVGLARALATLAGAMLEGRGLALFFDLHTPTVAHGYRMPDADADDVSSTLVRRVRERRRPLLCPDVRIDVELGQLRSLRQSDVRSVLCAPILSAGACVGAIYIDSLKGWDDQEPQALALVEEICGIAAEVLEKRRRKNIHEAEPRDFGLLGVSAPWKRLMSRIDALTESRDPARMAFLVGETGTGKSAIAKAIHLHGPRRAGPLIVVNCGSIPGELFEALMFGSVKGAFTGAEDRPGFLGEAQGGTLFLDEIHHLPLAQQPKMLTALSSRKYRRVGERFERDLDIHLISATTADLKSMVQEQRFLGDLLRRVYVNVCTVPPLRERGEEDIALIARHLLRKVVIELGMEGLGAVVPALEDYFTKDGREFLSTHSWPWNVGQLESLFRDVTVQRLIAQRVKIHAEVLEEILGSPNRQQTSAGPLTLASGSHSYRGLMDACEDAKMAYIRALYTRCGENAAETARKLDCTRDIVHKYVRRERASRAKVEG